MDAPKPPALNAGIGNSVMMLRFSANVVRKSHLRPLRCSGIVSSESSTPRVRSLPPLKISKLIPLDGASCRGSKRSLTFFW